MKTQITKDMRKALDVITSCKNLLHLQTANNYLTALEQKHNNLPNKENKEELSHLNNFIKCWRGQINKLTQIN